MLSTFIGNVYGYWAAELDPAKTAEDLEVLVAFAARVLPAATVADSFWRTAPI